ncbi:MAG: bifunctional UDP-N-acetylglucosamine diphosphorylase/glucosamine-1-phosphate N-acetyltransferase GlmU [Desulfitobacteriaceae bacterium]|nr:bifunctional UDP-N-acetylglucosamine diphosphorylase/glucosamine-1-phosphate N-acetyltransferase GlmU [Desulfitobacteriaceae bacterium]MDD4752288.1 bifunctional UDP-N-acetylglucosamine diphosphorylase/glucosamine-1-phosphate N-acetyltransferase GlmU [Desulfitobacteriaceae bacterium]
MPFVTALILAAGKGTRMKSDLPKVLHKVGGKPMVEHVLDAVRKAGIEKAVTVVGHEADKVKNALGDKTEYVIQEQQLGTGHAVMAALPAIKESKGTVLIACGDTPLITKDTFDKLLKAHFTSGSVCTILSAKITNPFGYGRIIRNPDTSVDRIVEQKDALPHELAVDEINTGTYCFDLKWLKEAINKLTVNNAQGEYYLTDTVAFFVSQGLKVNAFIVEDYQETLGINSRVQLAEAEKVLRMRKAIQLMERGVTVVDPQSTFIDAEVEINPDTVIEPFTFIRGKTRIGSRCTIGPFSDISDCQILDNAYVNRSVIIESMVGENCTIGPFAYLRPGTRLVERVKVGDFVEIKNSVIGEGSKVPHLSYVGDAQVGRNVNIGCGTITCNYDGKKKHPTKIDDGAFIGSNTNLVAPAEVGEGAVIGAGSTITKKVPDYALAVGRAKQVNISEWATKKEEKNED